MKLRESLLFHTGLAAMSGGFGLIALAYDKFDFHPASEVARARAAYLTSVATSNAEEARTLHVSYMELLDENRRFQYVANLGSMAAGNGLLVTGLSVAMHMGKKAARV